MKKTIWLLLILLGTAGVVVFMKVNRGPRDVRKAHAVSVTGPELYKQYISDSVAASTRYSGNVVEVHGEVAAIPGRAAGGMTVVRLATDVDGAFINCTLEEHDEGLRSGMTVTLKGLCSGLGEGDADLGIPGDVYLSRCVIIR